MATAGRDRETPITVIADMQFRPGGEEAYLALAAARVAHRRSIVLETPRIFQSRTDPLHLLYVSEWPNREAHAQRVPLRVSDTTLHQTRPFVYYYYRPLYRYELIGAPIAEVRCTLVQARSAADTSAVSARLAAIGASHASNPDSVGRFVYQELDDPTRFLTISWWAAPGAAEAAGSHIVAGDDPILPALATASTWFVGIPRAEFPP